MAFAASRWRRPRDVRDRDFRSRKPRIFRASVYRERCVFFFFFFQLNFVTFPRAYEHKKNPPNRNETAELEMNNWDECTAHVNASVCARVNIPYEGIFAWVRAYVDYLTRCIISLIRPAMLGQAPDSICRLPFLKRKPPR